MKKLMLTLCLIITCTSAFAECKAIGGIAYFNVQKLGGLINIGLINFDQAQRMAGKSIETGEAVDILKGTVLDKVTPYPSYEAVSIVIIKGQTLYMFSKDIKCD